MAKLQLLAEEVVIKDFPLDKPVITIGRAPACDIVIDDDAVSTEHAKIELVPNDLMAGLIDVFIEDLGSTNGTFVNDESVKRRQLQSQDHVRIAWTEFKMVSDMNPRLAKTSVILR